MGTSLILNAHTAFKGELVARGRLLWDAGHIGHEGLLVLVAGGEGEDGCEEQDATATSRVRGLQIPTSCTADCKSTAAVRGTALFELFVLSVHVVGVLFTRIIYLWLFAGYLW